MAVVFSSMLFPPVSNKLQLTPWTVLNCSSSFMELLGVYYTALDAWRVGAEDLMVTVDRSDLVVFYVEHEYGGTWQTMKYAVNQKKKIINLVTK